MPFFAHQGGSRGAPDLDSIYMQALQLMSGQGGWPLNVFLTPDDLVPFYAGTYFPVEPRFGRPGFLALLQRILQFYRQEKEKIEEMKGQILTALTTLSDLVPEDHIPADLLRSGIPKIQPLLSNAGAVQQFPMMPYAQLVLRSARFDPPEGIPGSMSALERAKERGMALVLGGILTMWPAAFTATLWIPPGRCPTLKRCSTTTGRSWSFSPISGPMGSKIRPLSGRCG
jgi:uncharacterized protein YyaL (SSP411 family)